jgi:hypothetical protein
MIPGKRVRAQPSSPARPAERTARERAQGVSYVYRRAVQIRARVACARGRAVPPAHSTVPLPTRAAASFTRARHGRAARRTFAGATTRDLRTQCRPPGADACRRSCPPSRRTCLRSRSRLRRMHSQRRRALTLPRAVPQCGHAFVPHAAHALPASAGGTRGCRGRAMQSASDAAAVGEPRAGAALRRARGRGASACAHLHCFSGAR